MSVLKQISLAPKGIRAIFSTYSTWNLTGAVADFRPATVLRLLVVVLYLPPFVEAWPRIRVSIGRLIRFLHGALGPWQKHELTDF